MSVEMLITNIKEMSITKSRAPILECSLIKEIFENNADIYSADWQTRHTILEVPNLYCCKYYDDEDFIYSKLDFNISNIENIFDVNHLEYMMKNNLIINNSVLELDLERIKEKIIYLHKYVQSYYTSLRYLRPITRMQYMPIDFISWIINITDTIHILLKKDLIKYSPNIHLPQDKFEEMIYGLELITCHIRLIYNHYKARQNGIAFILKDSKIKEKHLNKLMRLVYNLDVIMIHFFESYIQK